MLIAYKKFNDGARVHTLLFPYECMAQAVHELATITDGRTVVSLAEGYEMPQGQPPEIASSIEVLPTPLPAELREEIKRRSPHCALIEKQMQEKVRERYTLDQELYYARIGIGAANGMYTPSQSEIGEMAEFGRYVESVREWGRQERAKLGL